MYLLRGIRTLDGGLFNLAIEGEDIKSITPSSDRSTLTPPGATVLSGDGLLVFPAFVDIHIHLDKAFLRDDLPETDGTLESAIRTSRARKTRYTPDEVAVRATRLIHSSIAAGVTRIRTHVDVDSNAGLVAIQGVLLAAARCADICDLQIVAFPQQGIILHPPARRLMEQAVECGINAVGGMPHGETDVG